MQHRFPRYGSDGVATLILVVNPNTNSQTTERLSRELERGEARGLFRVVSPSKGPKAIESEQDEWESTAWCLAQWRREMERAQGILVACYGHHPLVGVVREIMPEKPAVGIMEASLWQAAKLGGRVGILTSSAEWVPRLKDVLASYPFGTRVVSVLPLGLGPEDLEYGQDAVVSGALSSGMAMMTKATDVVCLGCASLSGRERELFPRYSIPVVDGVKAGVAWLLDALAHGPEAGTRAGYEA